ncbi:hypothetical protein NMG60_11006211 [Bertholletia excelsa]
MSERLYRRFTFSIPLYPSGDKRESASMAIVSNSASKQKSPHHKGKASRSDIKEKEKKSDRQAGAGDCEPPAKRKKCLGVRLVGGRIYDSENGKSCHQCRQKTMDFVAACKNQKGDKPCTIKFCHKCLFNRYGESAEEMAVKGDWNCPKCRGICNCSFCMKKRGHQPTGVLVHTARATGFSSVSELLHVKGHERSVSDKTVEDVSSGQTEAVASGNKPSAALTGKWGKENLFRGDTNSELHSLNFPSKNGEKKQNKLKRKGLKQIKESNYTDLDFSKKASSQIKPQASKCRIKKTQHSRRDDMLLLQKAIPHASKEQAKNSRQGIMFKENGNNRPPFSKTYFKENIETIQTVGDLEDEKKLETIVSEEVPSKMIECRKRKEKNNDKFQERAEVVDSQKLDIPLPMGTELTTVAGIELLPEDVGHALQFLEFCATFQEILDLKKGEPECIIRELIHGRRATRGRHSPAARFHIKLLSVVQEDWGENSPVITPKKGKNSWLHALQDCASRSQCILKGLKLDSFDWEADNYNSLGSSEKLKILNFLCDEYLGTVTTRSWIDEQNSKFVEKVKEARERVLAAKQKEKQLKSKMQNEVAKAIIAKNGVPLSISEHESIVSQIKSEAAQVHAEMLESEGMVPTDKERSDAVRTAPIIFDIDGHVYWRLKGYPDESNILLQDAGAWDAVGLGEKWFTCNVEQEKEIEKYIFSVRSKRLRSSKSLTDFHLKVSL